MSEQESGAAKAELGDFHGELSWPVFEKVLAAKNPRSVEALRRELTMLVSLFSCTATGEEAVRIRELLIGSMREFLAALQSILDAIPQQDATEAPFNFLVESHAALEVAVDSIHPHDEPIPIDSAWVQKVLSVLRNMRVLLVDLFPDVWERPGVCTIVELAMEQCGAFHDVDMRMHEQQGNRIRAIVLEIIDYFQNFQTHRPTVERSSKEKEIAVVGCIEAIRTRLKDVFSTQRHPARLLAATRGVVLHPNVPPELRAYILEVVGGEDFPLVQKAVEDLVVEGEELSVEARSAIPKRLEPLFRTTKPESVENSHFVSWDEIPFPEGVHIPRPPANAKVGYKGGAARVALKAYLGASLEGEIPLADFDMYAEDTPEIWEVAQELCVDNDGVEAVEKFDPGMCFATRDTDLNEVLLTGEGLYYTDDAVRASTTRIIRPGRGRVESLYGADCFFMNGDKFMSNKALWRLVKFVAEGKADGFALPKYNLQIDMGIYWLVLARKLSGKENGGEKLERMFHLGNKMGIIPERFREKPVLEFLNWMHSNLPFFDFESEQTDEDIANWLLNDRFLTFVAKQSKKYLGIRTDFSDIKREPGDEQEVVIDLSGYVPSAQGHQVTANDVPLYKWFCTCRNREFEDFMEGTKKAVSA